MLRLFLTILFLIMLSGSFAFQHISTQKLPDCVPDSLTAKSIAEIILVKYYGDKVKRHFPLKIKDKSNNLVWILEGSLQQQHGYVTMGGVPYIEIRKKDCCVLKITHGK